MELKKIELGCGEKPMEGYLHQDITKQENIELDFNCNPWEILVDEGSIDEIIGLAMMEHLRYSEFRKTLKHAIKILKKGGSFLFDVPDMSIWARYLFNIINDNGDKNPFEDNHVWATIYGWQRWTGDEHKSGWTKKMIEKELNDAGFSKWDISKSATIFIEKGIHRGRFIREGDAHLYIKAIK